MPDLSSVTSNFDLLGQLTNVTDAAGVSIYFNNQGLLVVSSNALGIVVTNKSDIFDRLTESTDANGLTISSTYDDAGRVLTTTYPDSGTEQFQQSALGVIAHTNQLGKITRYGYDVAGRVTAVTNANSEVRRSPFVGPKMAVS